MNGRLNPQKCTNPGKRKKHLFYFIYIIFTSTDERMTPLFLFFIIFYYIITRLPQLFVIFSFMLISLHFPQIVIPYSTIFYHIWSYSTLFNRILPHLQRSYRKPSYDSAVNNCEKIPKYRKSCQSKKSG